MPADDADGRQGGTPISYSYSIVGALVWNHSIPKPQEDAAPTRNEQCQCGKGASFIAILHFSAWKWRAGPSLLAQHDGDATDATHHRSHPRITRHLLLKGSPFIVELIVGKDTAVSSPRHGEDKMGGGRVGQAPRCWRVAACGLTASHCDANCRRPFSKPKVQVLASPTPAWMLFDLPKPLAAAVFRIRRAHRCTNFSIALVFTLCSTQDDSCRCMDSGQDQGSLALTGTTDEPLCLDKFVVSFALMCGCVIQ